jgi:hypothetical protein
VKKSFDKQEKEKRFKTIKSPLFASVRSITPARGEGENEIENVWRARKIGERKVLTMITMTQSHVKRLSVNAD